MQDSGSVSDLETVLKSVIQDLDPRTKTDQLSRMATILKKFIKKSDCKDVFKKIIESENIQASRPAFKIDRTKYHIEKKAILTKRLYDVDVTETEYEIITRFIQDNRSRITNFTIKDPLHIDDNLMLEYREKFHMFNTMESMRTYAIHHGQRKLLMTEIYYLSQMFKIDKTDNIPDKDDTIHVIYIGAASGEHTPFLAKLFPYITFHLYDPGDNWNLEYNKYYKDVKDRLYVYKEFFTDDTAKNIVKSIKEDIYPFGKNVILYVITDLRSGIKEDFEEDVVENMNAQMRWLQILQPKSAMLKFRLPYETENLKIKDFPYLDGEIFIQPWAPSTSTESRLIVHRDTSKNYTKTKLYNIKEYEDKMFYINNVERIFGYYTDPEILPEPTKDNLIDRCRDCYLECYIWRYYIDNVLTTLDITDIDPGMFVDKIKRIENFFVKTTQCLPGAKKLRVYPHATDTNIPIWDKLKERTEKTKKKGYKRQTSMPVDVSVNVSIERPIPKTFIVSKPIHREYPKNSTIPFSTTRDSLTGDIENIKNHITKSQNALFLKSIKTINLSGIDKDVASLKNLLKMKRMNISINLVEAGIDSSYDNMVISKHAPNIVRMIESNIVSCIIADTGSGKTAFMPFILAKMGYRVRVTIPIVKAVYKVYQYQKENSGLSVGFAVGGDRQYTDDTSLVYMTAGYLYTKIMTMLNKKTFKSDIKELLGDILFIDEVHSGSIHTSALIGLLACIYGSDKEWKGPHIVFASATLNLVDITPYFNIPDQAKVNIPVPSPFNVDIKYIDREATDILKDKDYYDSVRDVLDKEIKIYNRSDKKEDYVGIIFRPGVSEVQELLSSIQLDYPYIHVVAAYSEMTKEELDLLDVPSPGRLKIIIGTNVLESSITIKNVMFVIDDMLEKVVETTKSGNSILKISVISRSSSQQRKGRTGRTNDGRVYRLISEDAYNQLDEYRKRDIDRIPIHDIVLDMIDANLHPVKVFNIEEQRYRDIVNVLYRLGTIKLDTEDEDEKNGIGLVCTDKGRFVSMLSTSIYSSIMIYNALTGISKRYTDTITTIIVIACMIDSYTSGFYHVPKDQIQNRKNYIKEKFKIYDNGIEGSDKDNLDDIDNLLAIYKDMISSNDLDEWCTSRSMNCKKIKEFIELSRKVIDILKKSGNIKDLDIYNVKNIDVRTIKSIFVDTYQDRFEYDGRHGIVGKKEWYSISKDNNILGHLKQGDMVACAKIVEIVGIEQHKKHAVITTKVLDY